MPNRLGWLMKFSFRVYLMSVRVISWRNTISKLRLCLGWNWNECRLTSCNIKNSSFSQSLTLRVTSTRQKFYSRENQIYWCNHQLLRMQIFKNFKILDFFFKIERRLFMMIENEQCSKSFMRMVLFVHDGNFC